MPFDHPLDRRALLGLAATLPLAAYAGNAAAFPSRPISVMVPYAPGGATDVVARVVAQFLGVALGGTVIVENKPGGSGTIAMAAVAKAAPDGYTLMLTEITSTVVGVLVPRLSFDPVKDFSPIAVFADTPYVLVVNDKLPVKSLQELAAYAKANPGKLNYGSGGVGSGPHIAGELFKSLAQADIRHVPYKGSGPALQDLIGGQIDLLITAAPAVASLAGRVRPLAVARTARLALLPDIPSAPETGMPGFVISNWFGLAAPRGTPPAVVQRLADAVAEVMKKPEVLEKLAATGAEPLQMGPAEARRKVQDETRKWSALIKSAGIKNDN